MNAPVAPFRSDRLGLPLHDGAGGDDVAEPRGDIRRGALIAFLFFGLFLGWAAFARLDAGVYAQGSLVVSGQRQSVQHREGGVVGEILVREGQRVRRGQLLVRLADPVIQAQERSLSSQVIRLWAQHARLEAEGLGLARVAPPPEFASLRPQDRAEAAASLKLQQAELEARSSVLAAQRAGLGQRVAQSGEQGQGYRRQAASAAEQLRLIDEELAALKPVADRGFVSQTRMRELERARAQLIGERGQYAASVAQASGAARENQIRTLEAERTYRERTTSELRDVDTTLDEVLPKLSAARDQLAKNEITAPATGSVVGLSVFTPGGVIGAGQKLMDIVPEREPLIIQARISPDDADDLTVGQRTLVKFESLHERTLPNLEGRLTKLSADSFVEERTGQSYFSGEVTVPQSQLQLIRGVRGKDFALRAGMPVQILIPLRKRTALEYAFEPLFGAFWASFREH